MAGSIVVAVLALALAGCAAVHDEPVPAACLGEPAAIVRALARAPDAVTLSDGTRLSTCVRRAREDGDLQALGMSLITVADMLRAQLASDPERATALADDAPAAAQAARESGLRAGAGGG